MSEAVVPKRLEFRTFGQFWEMHGSGVITALCLIFTVLGWLAQKQGSMTLGIVLFLFAYVIGGFEKAKEGLQTLIQERNLDVDLLMVVAAIGAAIIGYWLDGAILIFIFSLSGTLEGYTMERTNKDIQSIMNLRPEKALVLRGSAQYQVRVEELSIGDRILVKPGERLPSDGIVLEGSSAVNQASITGESIPVDKSAGDEVFAGTINGQGSLIVEVTKRVEDTLLAKIIRLVQEAQSELPPSQLFVERFEGIYAKIVVVGAVLLMVLPPFLLKWSWDVTIYRAMIFLVVASPCALVSSIMPAILSGISNGARHGVLIKGGVHLENIGHVKVVAFDKTGTLTAGEPKVTDVIPFEGYSEHDVLQKTASLEALSEHPIARAIVSEAAARKLTLQDAANLQAVPGFGVYGLIHEQEWRIGKHTMEQVRSLPETHHSTARKLADEGKTVIFAETEGKTIGMLAIQDTLRPEAKAAVKALKHNGIRVVMLTGDSNATAKAIGAEVGVDEIQAELMPEDKVRIVKNLTNDFGKVAMVGDGVNDAPALATSAVGIAMGAAGTDVAMETAKVVLMADDISKVAYAINLGRRTTRVIKQNIAFAIAVIVVLVVSNFLGSVTLPLGVVGHEGSTLAVILSGLRLLH